MEERCYICGKIITKDEIGINKKLVDENLKKFQCIDCLSSDLDISVEALEEKIEDFKKEGCKLFL